MMEELKEARIQTSVHYPPVHLFSLYRKEFGYRDGMLPKTEEVARTVLTLPLHPRMGPADARRISRTIGEIARRWS